MGAEFGDSTMKGPDPWTSDTQAAARHRLGLACAFAILATTASCSRGCRGSACAKNEDCGRNLVCFAPTEAMRGGLGASVVYDELKDFLAPYTCVSPQDLARAADEIGKREAVKKAQAEEERRQREDVIRAYEWAGQQEDNARREQERSAVRAACVAQFKTMRRDEWESKWKGFCKDAVGAAPSLPR